MFHIAIVDDDQSIHQKLEEMITSILFKYPIHFTVSHFFSGNEFLTNKDTFSLILLDIEMNDGDGILTKNSLEVHTPIIFLSSYQDRMIEAFGNHVIAYLLKNSPTLAQDLKKYLLQISKIDCIYLDNQMIDYQEIIYLKADNVYTIIHTYSKDYLIRKSLKNMEKELHFPFYRVHKSYIINFDYLKDINHLELTLTTSEIIKISRGKLKDIQQSYYDYIRSTLLFHFANKYYSC